MTTLAQFRGRIEKLRQRAANQRYYIDPKALKSLCTQELVRNVVEKCDVPSYNRKNYIETIEAVAFVTLSILVHINKERLIVRFLESAFKNFDDRLPMDMNELNIIAPEQLMKFEEQQWEFIPVILERYTHKNIADRFILPFKEDVRRFDSDGSFGQIYSVTIEAAMQELLPAPLVEVGPFSPFHPLQANSLFLNRLPPLSK